MINIRSWFTRAKRGAAWLYNKLRGISETSRQIALVAAEATLEAGNEVESWEPEDLALLTEARELVVEAQALGAGVVVGPERLMAVRLALEGADRSIRIADDRFDTRWSTKYRPWIEAFIRRMKARRLAGFEPSAPPAGQGAIDG